VEGVSRGIRHGACWVVTLGLLGWVFYKVPWREVLSKAAQVDLSLLLVAVGLSIMANIWFGCEKYRLILRGLGVSLPQGEVILLKMGSLPIKSMVPMKLGEVARLAYLRRLHGVSWQKGGVSVLLNLGATAVALFVLAGSASVPLGQSAAPWLLVASLALGAAGAGGLAGRTWSGFLGPRLRPMPGASSMDRVVKNLGPRGMGALAAYSLLFEGTKLLNYGLLFSAMGIRPPWDQIFGMVPMLILASSLPVSLMGIGVREGGVLLAFAGRASEDSLVGAGIWLSVVEGIVPVAVGLVLLRSFLVRLVDRDGKEPSGGTLKCEP
jgi:uncharacterized membrane protein YbhN (UPF0104 family)